MNRILPSIWKRSWIDSGIVPDDGSVSYFYAKEAADWFGGFFYYGL